jgi:hypothetical protein
MRDWGYRAFLEEAQHKVDEVEGALWSRDSFKRPPGPLPDMKRASIVAIDIATTSEDGSDETGIVVAGRGRGRRWLRPRRSLLPPLPGRLGAARGRGLRRVRRRTASSPR